MNYKLMIQDILPMVEDDFCHDMCANQIPCSQPFTQEESSEMANRLGKIYKIAHQTHCDAHGDKYKGEK